MDKKSKKKWTKKVRKNGQKMDKQVPKNEHKK